MRKINSGHCPTGIRESWASFPWHLYRGGVDVTFALVRGSSLFLVKEGRYSYVMPKLSLRPSQVLADLIPQVPGGSAAGAEVVASYDDGATFRVLVAAPCVASSPSFMELKRDALLLGGYASGDVMASFAAHVLEWPEASKHLPLPQAAALALAA